MTASYEERHAAATLCSLKHTNMIPTTYFLQFSRYILCCVSNLKKALLVMAQQADSCLMPELECE